MTTYTSFHATTHNAIRTRIDSTDFDYGNDPQGSEGSAPVVIYDNDGRPQPGTDRVWIHAAIRPCESRQITMGDSSRVFRHIGVVAFEVFQRNGTGTASAAFFCDRIASRFRGVTASGVTYQTPVVSIAGTDDGGQWFKMNVRVPWYADDNET